MNLKQQWFIVDYAIDPHVTQEPVRLKVFVEQGYFGRR